MLFCFNTRSTEFMEKCDAFTEPENALARQSLLRQRYTNRVILRNVRITFMFFVDNLLSLGN